eukprot:scaffold114518_cov22-Tisochrysis_lutea.AAC.2
MRVGRLIPQAPVASSDDRPASAMMGFNTGPRRPSHPIPGISPSAICTSRLARTGHEVSRPCARAPSPLCLTLNADPWESPPIPQSLGANP